MLVGGAVRPMPSTPCCWSWLRRSAGVANPLYSLLIAYTNDFLDSSDMAAASAGLLFINGLGAIIGPLVIGWLMRRIGPTRLFPLHRRLLFAALAAYAGWRMTRRAGALDRTERRLRRAVAHAPAAGGRGGAGAPATMPRRRQAPAGD